MSDIEVRSLTAGYPGHRVLAAVDLSVPKAGVTAVLGHSGCGKSTLLRAVAGLPPRKLSVSTSITRSVPL